ncbi:MAG: flagellar biosynthetic protein FliQ [Gemmatimonadales bacterium]|jgi:flagellar biosynthetic protein FliQ|nr:flagellar type III secretion system protein FliQ [Gemmatimonadota bacterium]MDX2057834.1 flagellar biosynthetic protein FliQ [Gemmatimonadales bacterium]
MSAMLAAELIRKAVMLTLVVSAPLLVSAVVVGLLVTLIQAVTQLQEQTLTFLPKLLTMAVIFVMVLPWMLRKVTEFLVAALQSLPSVAG